MNLCPYSRKLQTTKDVYKRQVLGGVKTGSNITNSSGTISLSSGNVTSALGYTPVKNESGVASIRVMTQSAYDALSSKSATTLYIITG